MKRPKVTTAILPIVTFVTCGLLLAGCTPDNKSSAANPPSQSDSRDTVTPSPGPSRPMPPTATPGTGATPQPDQSDTPEVSVPLEDAKALGQRACTLFGKTFEQEIATKFPNQEAATSMAQQAAAQDNQWKAIAQDMSLITSVGKRINLDHDPTVTPSETNEAGQAVADLQQKCAAAGAGFVVPAD